MHVGKKIVHFTIRDFISLLRAVPAEFWNTFLFFKNCPNFAVFVGSVLSSSLSRRGRSTSRYVLALVRSRTLCR